ncbi:unnamed protein product, partial [marine sediment metagenome]
RLFDTLTRESGRIVHSSNGQDLVETARAQRYPVYRLEGIFSAMQHEVIVAGAPKLLYPGQVLEIAVRLRRPSSTLRLVLIIDGRNNEISIPLQPAPLTEYLAARAWAEVHVGRLLDEPDDSTVQAIYALSKHFALSNDCASFIILETDEEYRQYGIVRRELDFRRVQLLLRSQRGAGEKEIRLFSGMLVPQDLGEARIRIVKSFAGLEDAPVWVSPPPLEVSWGPKLLLQKPPVEHTKDTPAALYLLAEELFGEARSLREVVAPTKED